MTTLGSPNYGRYMSKTEVLDLISPPRSVSQSVVQWVRGQCSKAELLMLDNRRDTVRVEATVSCVKRLLNVRFATFEHIERQVTCTRLHPETLDISLPDEIKAVVDLVVGLDMLPIVRQRKVMPAEPKPELPMATYDYVWLGSINHVYNIGSNSLKNGAKVTQSVIEFTPEGAPSPSDLQLYDQWSQIPFSNFSKIVGPWNPGNNGESLLDIQLISAVAQTPTAYITVNDGWVHGMAQLLFTMKDTPLVNSVSYGWPEALTCQSYVTNAHCNAKSDPKAYVEAAELELKKLGAIGVTVVVCSQDEGAPSEQNDSCQLDSTQPVWSIYPGSSAYALSVSATTLVTTGADKERAASVAAVAPICQQGYACSTGTEEVPCSRHNTLYEWTTGGGFADYVPRPVWQANQVDAYLKTSVPFPPATAFNRTNRAYPDVSKQAKSFSCFFLFSRTHSALKKGELDW